MVLSGNGFQTQQSPHGGMNLVRAIFVGLFDLLQPNIRAGVDFRWVIIALIGGEEVVERLRTGRLVVNRLFIGIWHRDLTPFWKFTANEVIPCTQHALPLHHTEEGGRIHFRENPYTDSILKHGIEHSRFFVPAKLSEARRTGGTRERNEAKPERKRCWANDMF